MRTERTAPALIGVALLLTLTACVSEPGVSPSESAGTSSTRPPSAEPTATGPTTDAEDPATWVIGTSGIGPVEIGGDFAETLESLPDSWNNDPGTCAWAAFWNAADGAYGMHFVQGTEGADEPIRAVSTSRAADDIVEGAGPRTADGLGIGSTREEVRAQHPDAVEGESAIDGAWLEIPGADGSSIFFQYAEGTDRAWAVTVTDLPEPPYEVCG